MDILYDIQRVNKSEYFTTTISEFTYQLIQISALDYTIWSKVISFLLPGSGLGILNVKHSLIQQIKGLISVI